MEITSSYQVEILSNTDMKNTVQIYRMALAFVVDVCNKEWTDISSIEAQVQKKSFVEKLECMKKVFRRSVWYCPPCTLAVNLITNHTKPAVVCTVSVLLL